MCILSNRNLANYTLLAALMMILSSVAIACVSNEGADPVAPAPAAAAAPAAPVVIFAPSYPVAPAAAAPAAPAAAAATLTENEPKPQKKGERKMVVATPEALTITAGSGTQNYGGTLKVGTVDFGTMDPALMGLSTGSAIYSNLAYDNLTEPWYDGSIMNRLAKEWSASDNQ